LPDVMKPFFLNVHERLWPIYQSNLMQFPEAGCPPCMPWQPLPSWWLKQTNLLWDKNS
jgi:hypothetical protein